MRKKRISICKSLGALAALGTMAVTNHCIKKAEERCLHKPDEEAKLQRRLTVLSIIYHIIGIFYNE